MRNHLGKVVFVHKSKQTSGTTFPIEHAQVYIVALGTPAI